MLGSFQLLLCDSFIACGKAFLIAHPNEFRARLAFPSSSNNAVLSAADANLQAAVIQGQDDINSLSGELASRSLPLDSTSERSFEDISRANSISSHGHKRKSKLKVPVQKAWNGAKDEEIAVFLARMELYFHFQAHNEPKAAWSTIHAC